MTGLGSQDGLRAVLGVRRVRRVGTTPWRERGEGAGLYALLEHSWP